MYSVSATTNATSWPWKRTLSVASTACTSCDSVGIQARLQRLQHRAGDHRLAPSGAPRRRWCRSTRCGRGRTGCAGSRSSSMPGIARRRRSCPAREGTSRPPCAASGRSRWGCRPGWWRCLGDGHAVHLLGWPGARRPSGPRGRCSRSRCSGRSARRSPRGSRPRSGRGCGPAGAAAVIIIPGVQKPHCRPCSLMKPCCTGSSAPPTSRPSTVRTARPSAIAASTVQLFTGTLVQPARRTRRSWRCRSPSACRSAAGCRAGSARAAAAARPRAVTSSPLTVIVTCIVMTPFRARTAAARRSARAVSSPARCRL